jgi:hypothetical protein
MITWTLDSAKDVVLTEATVNWYMSALVAVPTVAVPVRLRLNEAVGVLLLPLPPNPITITYRTAARTTVIATIRMVAMTGETALLSFLIFHIFFIII